MNFATAPASAIRYAANNPTVFDVDYLGSPSDNTRTYELNMGQMWVHVARKGKKVECEFVNMDKFIQRSNNPAHDMAIHTQCKKLTVMLEATAKTDDLVVIAQATELYYKAASWAITVAYEFSHNIQAEPKPAFVK